jgi:broad specificity phosphatase PhoE
LAAAGHRRVVIVSHSGTVSIMLRALTEGLHAVNPLAAAGYFGPVRNGSFTMIAGGGGAWKIRSFNDCAHAEMNEDWRQRLSVLTVGIALGALAAVAAQRLARF